MKIHLIISLVINLAICIIILTKIINNKGKTINFKGLFYLLAMMYLSLCLLNFLWLIDFLKFNNKDFLTIFGAFVLIESLFMFKIYYALNPNRFFIYLLIIYFVSLLSIYSSFSSFPIFILMTSYFLILIISINLLTESIRLKNPSYSGIVYSTVSLIITFYIYFMGEGIILLEIISPILFVFFIFYLLDTLPQYKILKRKNKLYSNESIHFIFIKYFIYVLVLINLVFVSTIGIHELGHVATARLYGCESRSIFYEVGEYPYSEIVCDNLEYKTTIILAGIVIPIILGLFLFLLGDNLLRVVSLMMIGFNLIASYKDLSDLGFSENISFATTILGMIVLLIGIYYMIKIRVDHHDETTF